MFFKLLIGSLTRMWKRRLLVVLSAALGASVAAAMLGVSLDIGDKMNRELKSYGANLVITAGTSGEHIDEEVLPKLKTIFWRNNIVGFAPFLDAQAGANAAGRTGAHQVALVGTWFDRSLVIPTGETARAGIKAIRPWWKVDGRWPGDDERAGLVGEALAERLGLGPGDTLELSLGRAARPVRLEVAGVLESGDADDERVFVPLSVLQRGLGLEGKVARAEVSALTTPENELARKADADPGALTPREFEIWYCTAYLSSIAYQIEEVIPGTRARPVRQVSDSEGAILVRIQSLMWLLTAAALLSSALGISSLMSAGVLERSVEIGLSKAIGAEGTRIAAQFLAEAAVVGLAGGLVGYAGGIALARLIGATTFDAAIQVKPFVLPLTLALSVAVVWLSSASAISTLLKLSPKEIMHGR